MCECEPSAELSHDIMLPYLNCHPLEVMSRYRNPQVGEKLLIFV